MTDTVLENNSQEKMCTHLCTCTHIKKSLEVSMFFVCFLILYIYIYKKYTHTHFSLPSHCFFKNMSILVRAIVLVSLPPYPDIYHSLLSPLPELILDCSHFFMHSWWTYCRLPVHLHGSIKRLSELADDIWQILHKSPSSSSESSKSRLNRKEYQQNTVTCFMYDFFCPPTVLKPVRINTSFYKDKSEPVRDSYELQPSPKESTF